MTANEQTLPLQVKGNKATPRGVAAGIGHSTGSGQGIKFLGSLLLLGVFSAAGYYYWQSANRPVASPAARARIVRPEMRELNATVVATGTIRLRSGAEVRVGAEISGIVTKLNVTVGSHIQSGEVIAEIESRGLESKIAQARAQIEVDQAALKKVERDLERSHKLLASGLIPKQQAEDLEADLISARARLDKSRSDLAVVESDLPYLTIRAPIAGTVASVSTQQGETVAASFNAPTFVTIIEDNALELIAMVDETDIGNVRPANPVTFTTETFPSQEFRGVVERVAPKATIISGVVNYETAIAIQTGSSVLKPDMTANVTISTARRRVLMVPAEAIHKDSAETFVYVARNGRAEKRAIVTGSRDGSWSEVKKGLGSGDSVLIEDPSASKEKR
jgi:RND family efflux transporter MFP subunit